MNYERIRPGWQPPSPTATTPLTLVVIYVSDLQASTRFYSAVGLQFQEEKHGNGPPHYSTTLPGGTVIELYPQGKRQASRNRLGFAVSDLPSAVAAVEAINPACVISGPAVRDYGTVAVVEDPDGNRVELLAAT